MSVSAHDRVVLRTLNMRLDALNFEEKALSAGLAEVRREKSLILRSKHAVISASGALNRNANTRDQPLIRTVKAKITVYLANCHQVGNHYADIATFIGEKKSSVQACLSKHPEFCSDNSDPGFWCLHSRYYEGISGNHTIGG